MNENRKSLKVLSEVSTLYRSTCVLLLMLGVANRATTDETGGGTLTPPQRELNRKSFQIVWETVRDKHFDPKLGGLDWQKIRTEFEPKIDKAQTMAEFRRLVNEMIGRLGQSHFGLISAEAYKAVKPEVDHKDKTDPKTASKPSSSGRDVPGFDVRVVDGKALVIKVTENTPAAKAGIRPGWEVLRIEGTDIPELLAKLGKPLREAKNPDLELNLAVLNRLRGKAGDKKEIVFRDGKDKEVSVPLELIKPQGTPATLGHMPTIYVTYTSRKIDKTIGYFHLSAFFDPGAVMKALEGTIKDNLKSDGFILDLRGNPGGIGFMAVGFGGFFIDKAEQHLGTMSTRDGILNFVINPRAEPYTGPLAILVDSLTGSTSEILAGGLQDLKRARVFGTRSMGAALPSLFIRLPNGDGFQYAFANYVSAGGKALEGLGVMPDTEVRLTRAALLSGQDPVLDAAVGWIRTQKR
jgi:carboxyl-terminal processing protease